MKTLLLIDSHALIHRFFHALPPLTTPSGHPANVIYGMANIALRIHRETRPDYVAAVFDRPEKTFRDEIFKEYNQLRQHIRGYEELLSSEQNILAVIRADMVELRDKYGEDRRTEVIEGELSRATMEELIVEETNAVTLSHDGYIKRLPLNTYRTQHPFCRLHI